MKQLLVFSAVFVWVSTAYSQGSTTGGSALKLPLTALSASLGESDVAVAGLSSAFASNPGILGRLTETEIIFTHLQWIQEINGQSLFAGTPLPFGSAALGVMAMSIPGIEVRDRPGPAIGTFAARALSIRGLFAGQVSQDFSVGAGLKYLYEKLYVDDATGYAADVGAFYTPANQPVTVGAALLNLGAMEAFRSEPTALPTSAVAGGSYRFSADAFDILLAASVSHDTHLGETQMHFGGTVAYRGFVALRMGYQTGFESRGLSAGLGIRFQFVRLEYAYVPFGLDLGNAQMLSIDLTI